MKKHGIACAALLCAAAATVTAACSSTSTPTPSGTSGTTGDAATPPNNIIVGGSTNQFMPSTLTVKVGDTVTWSWAGGAHTVTSGANCMSDGMYGTNGTVVAVGATFTHTYTTAGTFEFFCEPHCVSSGMKGSIVVK